MCSSDLLTDSLTEELNQRTDVLMEEEISEQHTEMLPAVEGALKPYVFYSNNCFVSIGFIADAEGNILDQEIELIRRMMMKVSRKRPAAVKQRRSRKRKTTEDCESIANGAMQHNVWRPGEEQQTEAAKNGKLQHKIWNPGRKRSEHMIRRS